MKGLQMFPLIVPYIGRPNITNAIKFILRLQQNLPFSIQMIKLLLAMLKREGQEVFPLFAEPSFKEN
jgi:hypothetical protein